MDRELSWHVMPVGPSQGKKLVMICHSDLLYMIPHHQNTKPPKDILHKVMTAENYNKFPDTTSLLPNLKDNKTDQAYFPISTAIFCKGSPCVPQSE